MYSTNMDTSHVRASRADSQTIFSPSFSSRFTTNQIQYVAKLKSRRSSNAGVIRGVRGVIPTLCIMHKKMQINTRLTIIFFLQITIHSPDKQSPPSPPGRAEKIKESESRYWVSRHMCAQLRRTEQTLCSARGTSRCR